MAHQAYFFAGEREEGIEAALAYVREALDIGTDKNPDVIIERYGLFSVEDARRVIGKAALAPMAGSEKAYIIAAQRIFHEAQNALLKLFEEPPEGTTLILIVPSEGDIIYTLRSRLQPLPVAESKGKKRETSKDPIAEEFAAGGSAAREKVVAKILDEAKSDNDEEKQEARAKALRLAEGLARAGYVAWRKSERAELEAFLHDLDRLIPILHDRAAPLKPILEHILIIAPKKFN